MSDQKQFLVAGATLECPYGSKTSKLLPGGKSDALSIGERLFLSVNAAEKGKNIVGFEKCQSEYCKGQPCACMARMRLARSWMNPVSGTKMLTVQNGEEAIHRKAKLLCLFGRTYIKALTTGQDELLPSEKKFYQYMKENFGFDDEVIGLMLKVIHAIDEKYPDKTEREKAWMFARLMGGFSYGDGSEDKMIQKRDREAVSDPKNAKKQKKDIRKWINTAGESPFMEGVSELTGENYENREKDYFTTILGLSEEEYKTLRFHVRAQHEITSRPEGSHPMKMKEGQHFYYDVWRDEFFMEDGFGEKLNVGNDENNKKNEEFQEEWERLFESFIRAERIETSEDREAYKEYEIISDDEGNEYALIPQYSDFSHQQILTSTILVEDNKADQTIGNVAGGIVGMNALGSHSTPIAFGLGVGMKEIATEITEEYRTDLAGWLGDIWLADNKMSLDDYKADLDGVNIAGLIMNEDINTVEAVNEYYESISNGATTREREFVCNKGSGDIETGMANIIAINQTFCVPEQSWAIFQRMHFLISNEKYYEKMQEADLGADFINQIREGI